MLSNQTSLLYHALNHNYILGAFNVYNLDSLTAIISAAEKEQSPVILQVSLAGRQYTDNFEFLVKTILNYISETSVPAVLQHDHCKTYEKCKEVIDLGIPAIMFDGSSLPFEKNMEETRKIVEYAHSHGAIIEAELGCIPGFEDEVFSEKAQFTDPVKAKQFVDYTGCDSLAVAVGTSHGGVLSDHSLIIDFDRLQSIHQQLGNFPIVLHGAASLEKELIDQVNDVGMQVPYIRNASEEQIANCRNYGVAKANMDVDNFMVFTTAVREYMIENPAIYDPRMYLKEGRLAFENMVRHKMRKVLFSSNTIK